MRSDVRQWTASSKSSEKSYLDVWSVAESLVFGIIMLMLTVSRQYQFAMILRTDQALNSLLLVASKKAYI